MEYKLKEEIFSWTRISFQNLAERIEMYINVLGSVRVVEMYGIDIISIK